MGLFEDLVAAGHAVEGTCSTKEPVRYERYYECTDGFWRWRGWSRGSIVESNAGYSRACLDAEREATELFGSPGPDEDPRHEAHIRKVLGIS